MSESADDHCRRCLCCYCCQWCERPHGFPCPGGCSTGHLLRFALLPPVIPRLAYRWDAWPWRGPAAR